MKALIKLYLTAYGRKIKAVLWVVIPRVASEYVRHPEWTADDRRNRAIELLTEEIGAISPGWGHVVNFAIEWIVASVRAELRERES